jgi:hypothetical protein
MTASEVHASSPLRIIWAVILLWLMVVLGAEAQKPTPAGDSTANSSKTGTMVDAHSDKRVVQTGRWYVVRQFTVDFAVKCPNQTYCGEVTTTVINEVNDLMASKGQSVELLETGKDIDVTLHNGRRIKAHQVAANKCERN